MADASVDPPVDGLGPAAPREIVLDLPACAAPLVLGRRPLVMGVVNLTPDSFSDGGLYFPSVVRAVEHALRLVDEGADLLDLGAESTRPGGGVYGAGSVEVSADDEARRLLPVLEALRARLPSTALSVDTRKGEVARRALDVGADLVNDVGCLADPALRRAVAEAGCPVVAMHARGELRTMQSTIAFDDVVAEVESELLAAAARGVADGIDRRRIVLDPGIGFGKTAEQNLALMHHAGTLRRHGHGVLVGASRKSFIAAVAGEAPPDQRLGGSLAVAAWCARIGVDIVRVHDVAATVQLLRVWNAIDSAS
ncbi:MAG: dihydropteroate synthase [Acidobacteriota bacterium]